MKTPPGLNFVCWKSLNILQLYFFKLTYKIIPFTKRQSTDIWTQIRSLAIETPIHILKWKCHKLYKYRIFSLTAWNRQKNKDIQWAGKTTFLYKKKSVCTYTFITSFFSYVVTVLALDLQQQREYWNRI